MAGISLVVALHMIRDEHLPLMRRANAETAYAAGQLAATAETDLERELIQLWMRTVEAHASVLDLLDGLVAAVDL